MKPSRDRLPYVSVIVPTYRDWERLRLCLKALEQQTYPKDKFEIIVINNDPDDVIPPNFTLPENCILMVERKPGSYAARNKGLSVANGSVYAFTDSDCKPDEKWLSTAIAFLDEHPEVQRIGGEVSLFSRKNQYNWFEIYELFFAFPQESFVKDKGMAATANMISKKSVFDQIGWFDETLMSGGDGEWGERASRHGAKISYLGECIVYHPTRDRFSEILLKNRRLTGGHYLKAKENGARSVAILMFKSLVPPIYAIKTAVKKKNQSVRYKIIAILVTIYLKYLAAFELLKLIVARGVVERL